MIKSDPVVSVIIPTYNAALFVTETIKSVLKQTYSNYEIVVVDDGSTDNTVELISKIESKNIRIFQQRNQGNSASRNLGIAKARGEFIALLDHDDCWLPEKLERQMELFQRNPNLSFVFSDFFRARDTSLPRISAFAQYKHVSRGHIFHQLLKECFVLTSTIVIRKDILTKVGSFNTKLFALEDRELWLRLALAGEADYIPEMLVFYRMHQHNTSRSRKWEESRIYSFKYILASFPLSREYRKTVKDNVAVAHAENAYAAWCDNSFQKAATFYLRAAYLGKNRYINLLRGVFALQPTFILNAYKTIKAWQSQRATM